MKTTWGEGNGGFDAAEARMVEGCVATVIDRIFDPGPAPDYTAHDQRAARRTAQHYEALALKADPYALKLPDEMACFEMERFYARRKEQMISSLGAITARLHERDLPGEVMSVGSWEHLTLPPGPVPVGLLEMMLGASCMRIASSLPLTSNFSTDMLGDPEE